ncbi:MAG TPA: efflux transporter periplasmic adaptor subunit [Synergistaceae bacterium]|nr:efflux transporter periplasmic adaptor subunit [Synergistaceae bacterium]
MTGRTRRLVLLTVGFLLLAGTFFYVMMRSGPLAPVAVVAQEVQVRSLTPSLFGIGTVEPRYTYRIGPVAPGRLKSVEVQVGDRVSAGMVLGEMDPVDLEERIKAQRAVIERIDAAVRSAGAAVSEKAARKAYAEAQSKRYDSLLASGAVSVEAAESKRQERQVTAALWSSARSEHGAVAADRNRAQADLEALLSQKETLTLTATSDGIVASRNAEPGSTVVAGLPLHITLRSRPDETWPGEILRVEPLADAVTEELLAKAVFTRRPDPAPPIGELAEVTVDLPPLAPSAVVPDGALHRVNGTVGVWLLEGGGIRFQPVVMGRRDPEGFVQKLEGVAEGDRVVVYSEKALTGRSRVKVVERVGGAEG